MIRHGIFREILAMAFDSLRSHKLRSFLTLLGIMIGVMTVIGMVSVIQGLNASFLKELQAAGSDLIIDPQVRSRPDGPDDRGGAPPEGPDLRGRRGPRARVSARQGRLGRT